MTYSTFGRSVTISLDGLDYPVRNLIQEIRREHAMRRRVYASQVVKGSMTPGLARTRIDMMIAIEGLLIRIDEAERK